MREILALLLVCATVSSQGVIGIVRLPAYNPDPLKCRRCIGARSLGDCTSSVPCPAGEVCYMEEVITQQLTIEYNGGCRPQTNCAHVPIGTAYGNGTLVACTKCCDTKTSPECNSRLCGIKGKFGNGALVACTKCCDNKTSPECNSRLCGIKGSTSTNQCFYCNSDNGRGSGVADPRQCTTLVACQHDEVCAAETYILSTHNTYEFKCLSKQMCSLLTVESLKRLKECRVANPDAIACGPLGKRGSPGFKKCIACCGDTLCNNDSCELVLERMYNLWTAGVLDTDTLKQNGSLPIPAPAVG